MKEIIRRTSTNGRFGLVIVSESDVEFPAKGTLTSLGKIEGHQTYKFGANEDGNWIYVDADAKPISGAVIVDEMNLQSSNRVTIIAGGDFFVVKSYGYKQRSSVIRAYKDGQEIDLPSTVLAAMGLISADNTVVEVEIPAIESPIAEALRKAEII